MSHKHMHNRQAISINLNLLSIDYNLIQSNPNQVLHSTSSNSCAFSLLTSTTGCCLIKYQRKHVVPVCIMMTSLLLLPCHSHKTFFLCCFNFISPLCCIVTAFYCTPVPFILHVFRNILLCNVQSPSSSSATII